MSGNVSKENKVVSSHPTAKVTPPRPEEAIGRIAGLLSGLIEDHHIPTSAPAPTKVTREAECQFENKLAIVRLGVATSLFYALRCKHPPTASHSLRVAMACSAWCERLYLSEEQRDRIEVAALLHDIGKIGIPDAILKKPAKLSTEEQMTVALGPSLGVEILRGCTDDCQMLDIIQYSRAWYEGRRDEDTLRGEAIPLGARMLAIVEAFDAMTTDQVYRPAMSRERALAELTKFAGSQFDPELAHDYHRMLEQQPELVHTPVIQRWLEGLRDRSSDTRWQATPLLPTVSPTKEGPIEGYFRQLLMHTHDGVAFIDRNGVVRTWNMALHHLTGVSAEAVCGNHWDPTLVNLCNLHGDPLLAAQCPILDCLNKGGHDATQVSLDNVKAGPRIVNLRISAVSNEGHDVEGVVAIFQDASHQIRLEKRVQDLNDRVTRDPLTGIANRAEFNRRIDELTQRARSGKGSFSLIITDIDRFKLINDNHGHPAGDEAIITFARLLTEHSREVDLVARYGGEEFVLLCPGCDNSTAAKRAEVIRQSLEKIEHSFLDNKPFTASFGVTEFQEGDTGESVLARADRALLRAKENGRNRVIQLGSGGFDTATKSNTASGGWFGWFDFGFTDKTPLQDARLVTPVPIDLVVEKLRGFIADHKATILNVGPDELELRVTSVFRIRGRRQGDHRIDFNVRLRFNEQTSHIRNPNNGSLTPCNETVVEISLSPVRSRDRRRNEIREGSQQVIASLQSYLMARVQPKNPAN